MNSKRKTLGSNSRSCVAVRTGRPKNKRCCNGNETDCKPDWAKSTPGPDPAPFNSLAKPVFSGLSFLVTLLALSGLYFQLSAHFIAALQILVYAGAILVIFMFVIVLFQDAYQHLSRFRSKSKRYWRILAASTFLVAFAFLGERLMGVTPPLKALPAPFGTVESLGRLLFIDFFFPFEVVIMLFLIALVGSIFMAKKENS